MKTIILMKAWCKKLVVLSALLLWIMAAKAQSIIFAEDAPGKISCSREGIFNSVNAAKGIGKAKAASLNQSLAEQLDIFYKSPLLTPPLGFSTKTFFSVKASGQFDMLHAPTTNIHFSMYYLEKDKQSGRIKTSMDGTGIIFETNSLDFFCDKIGNFWEDCHKLKLPLFFEQFPIVDSTADYIELNFKNYGYPYILNNTKNTPIRIIKRNNRPVFIPLSRKEFLQYVIACNNDRIKENRSVISDEKKQIESTKKDIANPEFQQVKAILEKTLPTMNEQIAKTNDAIASIQQKIAQYQDIMNAMSPREAAAPAWLDENKQSEELFGFEQLVPYGRQEGIRLCKINPDYYDKSPAAPAAQVIIAYYDISQISPFTTDPNYLQQKTVQLFNQFDYHQLKLSMK